MMPRTEAADAGILASRLLHANPAGRLGYIFPCCHSVAWGQAGVKPRPGRWLEGSMKPAAWCTLSKRIW
jgi:hypothetical protein